MKQQWFTFPINSKVVMLTFLCVCIAIGLCTILGFAKSFASVNDTNIMVTLQLELDGALPNCEKISVNQQEKSIDCHDAFFNDGPFLDRKTINFTLPETNSTINQTYEVCLYGTYGERILSCSKITNENDPNSNQTKEITFSFTDNGIQSNTMPANTTWTSSEFILNLIFMNEIGKSCPDFTFYVNHPKLSENRTSVNCKTMYYNDEPFKQIQTIEKIIPSNTIREEEVFEVCMEYPNGRTCELVKNDKSDNSEYVVFDLSKIV